MVVFKLILVFIVSLIWTSIIIITVSPLLFWTIVWFVIVVLPVAIVVILCPLLLVIRLLVSLTFSTGHISWQFVLVMEAVLFLISRLLIEILVCLTHLWLSYLILFSFNLQWIRVLALEISVCLHHRLLLKILHVHLGLFLELLSLVIRLLLLARIEGLTILVPVLPTLNQISLFHCIFLTHFYSIINIFNRESYTYNNFHIIK